MRKLLPLVLVVALLVLTAAATPANSSEEVAETTAPISSSSQSEVLTLDDDNFNDMVFPGGEHSPPFIVMFYAPWCPHCTHLKPVFANASIAAREDGQKAARFGIFDGTKSTAKLTATHNISVRSYPTMYYSVRGKLYKYEGSRGITHFIFASRMLAIQVERSTGILDDLSVDSVVRSLDNQDQGKYSRAAFVFGLPSSANNKPSVDLLKVVDATLTIGKARFAFVDTETEGKQRHIIQGGLAGSLTKAKENECQGPQGAVLAVESDAFETPDYFCGEWFEKGLDGEDRISADLKGWFTRTAFPAQEMVDGESWPSLAARGMVFVATLKGKDSKIPIVKLTDDEAVTLRQVARALNKVENPVNDVVVGWLDGAVHKEFLEGVGVVGAFPTVFVLNPKKEEAYYADADMVAKLQDATEGIAGAESTDLLVAFAEAVANGQVTASKYHWYGRVANALKAAPLLGYLHSMLQMGDLEYVAITLLLLATPILLTFAARGGGPDEYPNRGDLIRQQHGHQKQVTEKKKTD